MDQQTKNGNELCKQISDLEKQNNAFFSRIVDFEETLNRKDTDLHRMSVVKQDLANHVSSLQNNFERYTELVRETSIYSETEKAKCLEIEMQQLQTESAKLRGNNDRMQNKIAMFEEKEADAKMQILVLNQQVTQLERLLNNINKMQEQNIAKTDGDNLELNMDQYSRLIYEAGSRKESAMSEFKKFSMRFGEEEMEELMRDKLRRDEEGDSSNETQMLAFPNFEIDKNQSKPPKLEETLSVMYPQISTILKKKDSEEIRKRNVYAEFVYICFESYKISRIVLVENKRMLIFKNRQTKKPEREINLASVIRVVTSKSFPQIFEIVFQNNEKEEESLVFENYSADLFFEFISTNHGFDLSCKKNGDVRLASQTQFKNALCNIYKNPQKAGFLEQMDAGNSWGTWKPVFVVRLENIICIFQISEKYFYDKFDVYRKNAQLIRMEHYNVFNNGRSTGYIKENLFYVKIRNENRDLIFSSASKEEKKAWIQALSE